MTSASKSVYIDKLDYIVNKYNNKKVINRSKKVFFIKKVNNTVPWTYVISILIVGKIVGTFCGKELQKTNQKKFRVEKVIKRKGNKQYFKRRGYDNSFNSWTDKKDII